MPVRRMTALAALVLAFQACDPGPLPLAPAAEAPAGVVGPSIIDAPLASTGAGAALPGPALVSVTGDGWTVLDFEELASPTNVTLASYSGGGFAITVSNPLSGGLASWGSTGAGYMGSAALFVNDIRGFDAVLVREDGGLFAMRSIDVAPLLPTFTADVTLVGTESDGTLVSQRVEVPLGGGFQTFNLAGFGQVVEVRWTQTFPVGAHQFDNIVVGLPTPATRDDCVDGGWARLGFRSQGQCIRFVNTGRDSR